jgi:hypothetical protein
MARVTGGWRGTSLQTENRQSSETASKNAHRPSRPVHAMLGGIFSTSHYLLIESFSFIISS